MAKLVQICTSQDRTRGVGELLTTGHSLKVQRVAVELSIIVEFLVEEVNVERLEVGKIERFRTKRSPVTQFSVAQEDLAVNMPLFNSLIAAC